MDKQADNSAPVSINAAQAIICDECGERLAIFVVDTDWSEIDYTGQDEQVEEIMHGDRQYALCRECASGGSDESVAETTDPKPWEKQRLSGSEASGDEA